MELVAARKAFADNKKFIMNNQKDYISIHPNITCPYCNIKQTGFVQRFNYYTEEIVAEDLVNGHTIQAIKCIWNRCRKLISGKELEKAIEIKIKYPSDIPR